MRTTTVPPSRRVLVDCVHTATTAPSLHNSQPWRFRIDGPAVEVYADPRRRLEVVDPAGREQLISLGAAVYTLRLAIQQAGYQCELTAFPRADEPELVARVVGGRAGPGFRGDRGAAPRDPAPPHEPVAVRPDIGPAGAPPAPGRRGAPGGRGAHR